METGPSRISSNKPSAITATFEQQTAMGNFLERKHSLIPVSRVSEGKTTISLYMVEGEPLTVIQRVQNTHEKEIYCGAQLASELYAIGISNPSAKKK